MVRSESKYGFVKVKYSRKEILIQTLPEARVKSAIEETEGMMTGEEIEGMTGEIEETTAGVVVIEEVVVIAEAAVVDIEETGKDKERRFEV